MGDDTPTWATKDGEVIVIADMTPRHLVNTINMLIHKLAVAQKYGNIVALEQKLEPLLDEATKRGLFIDVSE